MDRIADEMDRASIEEQRTLERCIEAAKKPSKPPLPVVGSCYNCDEELGPGQRFCDSDCREDYLKRKASGR